MKLYLHYKHVLAGMKLRLHYKYVLGGMKLCLHYEHVLAGIKLCLLDKNVLEGIKLRLHYKHVVVGMKLCLHYKFIADRKWAIDYENNINKHTSLCIYENCKHFAKNWQNEFQSNIHKQVKVIINLFRVRKFPRDFLPRQSFPGLDKSRYSHSWLKQHARLCHSYMLYCYSVICQIGQSLTRAAAVDPRHLKADVAD